MFGAWVAALLAQPLDSSRRTAESATWQDFTFHLLQCPSTSPNVYMETRDSRHPGSDRLMSCVNTDDTWGDTARTRLEAYSSFDPDLSLFHFLMRQAFAQSHGTSHTELERAFSEKKEENLSIKKPIFRHSSHMPTFTIQNKRLAWEEFWIQFK